MTFFTYLWWSVQFLLAPDSRFDFVTNRGVTVLLIVNLMAAVVYTWRLPSARREQFGLLFSQLLFPPLLIGIGVVGECTHYPCHQPNYGLWLVNITSVAALLAGTFLIYRARGQRWLATSIMLLQLWWLTFAGFIAGMSVTHNWI